MKATAKNAHDIELDVSGRLCPYPLTEAKKTLTRMSKGQVLKIISTDPASVIDFKVFTTVSKNQLIQHKILSGRYYFWIKKG